MPHTKTIINDQEEPSVTEIISLLNRPYLMRWYGKLGNAEADKISKESRELGLNVHKMIDEFIVNSNIEEANFSSLELKLFKAWENWFASNKVEVIASEVKVVSQKYLYGGTFDALISIKDKKYLVDWKVSNNDDHFRKLQLAGYAQAFYEQSGEKIKNGMIVRIDKNGNVFEQKITKLWDYVPLFLDLRKMYDFINQRKKWKR